MKWTYKNKIIYALGLALTVLAIRAVFSFWNVRNSQEDANLISHTNIVLAQLEEVHSLVNEAESGQRGYIISQQIEYLEPYNESKQLISKKIETLKALTSDNSTQQKNLSVLQPLVQQRLDLLQKDIQVSQQQGFEAVKGYILTNNGFRLMEQIHATLDQMVAEETNLLQERSQIAQNGSTFNSRTFLILTLLSACLFGLMAYMLRQYSNDRRKAELELTEQKDFANNILDLSPLGKLVIDKQHKVLIWNPALEKLTGFKSAEMLGTSNHRQAFYSEERPTLNDMIIDQDYSQLDSLYQDYKIKTKPYGQSIRTERWFPNLNGKRRYIAFQANPIYNRDGTLKAAMTTFQDLTEYKKIEDALRESEKRFRLLTEKITVGVTLNGPKSEIILANDAASELLGLTSDQLLGRTSFDPAWKCIQEDGTDFPGEKHPLPQAILTKKPIRNVTMGVYRPKDASWVWLLVNAEPLLNEEGYVSNVICSFSDITERKKVEQLKTEFISVVSHELRTPLTSILGSLGLIMGGVAGEITPATRTMLGIAHKNSERLVRLINDILDIEKIESGKMIFHLRPLELAPLVKQAIDSTRSFADQYGVSFQCEIEDHLDNFMVMADNDRLIQVIINLLSNAAKFSPPEEPVKVMVFALNEKVVRISVTDKGPGISEEFKGRIFQKFAQADSSDTRQKGGTGLGLSISKAIIEKLKGTIDFTTSPGQGTTFYLDLPLLTDNIKNNQQFLLDLPGPTQNLATLAEILQRPSVDRDLKILICEDDHDVALLLYQTFRQLGFNCDIAYSAAESRHLLELNTYAVMTLDLLLPDEDGMALLRELRSREKTRLMPIIVVSAIAEQGEIEFNGQAFTVVDWINKPIDQARLISAIENAVRFGMSENKRSRILHIEDDRDLVQVVAVLLSGIAEVSSARTAKEAIKKLEEERFDLILLDVELPDSSSASLPALLNNPALGTIPVVVFSGNELEPGISRKIAGGLIKSRTTNQELINTIQNIFNGLKVPAK